MSLTRLSPEKFDELAGQTELEETTRQMARAVMVDGISQADVAKAHNTSRQRVFLAVGVIRKVLTKPTPTPIRETWNFGNQDLPASIHLALQSLAPALKAAPDEVQEAAVATILRGIRRAIKPLQE